MADPADPLALAGYQLRLPSFEGPLDVLLRLIEREKLAIADVSLVAVTDQFLDHLARLDEAAPAQVAAFSAVAARLLVLKSRALLPRPPAVEPDAEPDDLVRQLLEHRALRSALADLATRDRSGGRFFPPGGAVAVPVAASPVRLLPGPPGALATALRRRLSLVTVPPVERPMGPVVSLPETVSRMLGALGRRRRLSFSDLLGRRRGRQEVLVAFLAVLVLLRRKQIEVEQPEPFGEFDVCLLSEHPHDGGDAETGFA